MFQSAHVHFQWSKSVFRDPWSPGHEVKILLDGCVGQTRPAVSISVISVQLRISNQMLTLQPVQLCQDVLSTRRVLVLQAHLNLLGKQDEQSMAPMNWTTRLHQFFVAGGAAEVSSHIIAGKNVLVLGWQVCLV